MNIFFIIFNNINHQKLANQTIFADSIIPIYIFCVNWIFVRDQFSTILDYLAFIALIIVIHCSLSLLKISHSL